jgi:hypothetical protein
MDCRNPACAESAKIRFVERRHSYRDDLARSLDDAARALKEAAELTDLLVWDERPHRKLDLMHTRIEQMCSRYAIGPEWEQERAEEDEETWSRLT